ncbi:MAG: hemolysin family protein [Acidimicrobiia bacterium]|nr:hemolysin family protein [Acidimicrobiia bacterium]
MSVINIIYIAILAICAVGSGFFSGSETALIGIGRERVHQVSTLGRRGKRVAQLVADPERLLSTLLVANNLVNILGAAVATTLFISLIGDKWGPWVSTLVVTIVVLIVGEITPKTIAARYPERFSLAVAPTIWRLSLVLNPVARLFTAVTRGLLRMLRLSTNDDSRGVTEADIKALAELSAAGGEIEAAEREIIDSLFTLADRPVRDVMTPRIDIVTLGNPVSIEDVREAVSSAAHSRFPVTGGGLDDLIGILYVKDVLQVDGDPDPDHIAALLRKPTYVPESTPVLQVLQDMQSRRFTMALVLDEHGGVEGIITIKDLVSELVGELQDEYDPGVPSIVPIGAGRWMADGRLPIDDFCDAMGHEFPEGPYSTLGGMFLSIAGHIPSDGHQLTVDDYRLVVMRMDRNRIDRIRVERLSN